MMPIELSTARSPGRFTYWREIIAVLCLKLAGLTALYFLFFAAPHQPASAPQDVARHIVGSSAAEPPTPPEVAHD